MMIEVKLNAGTSIKQAVETLLKYKAEGKQAFCSFNGHRLFSDTVTLDSAYIEITGKSCYTEEERKRIYRKMVFESRIPGIGVHIEMPTVIKGLKFIVENPALRHEKLVQGLIDLGCNFTYRDYYQQFVEAPEIDIVEGLAKGKLETGADVIINARDSEYGRAIFYERLQGLAKRYIGKVTGDDSYGNGDESYTGGGSIKK